MSERKPLTLEELRKIVIDDNDCMAVVVVHDIKWNYDVSAVLDEVFGDGICAVYSAGPVEYTEKDYGKTWLAYAYEPPRLDRSAWEPCEFCGYAEYPDKALHPKEGYLFYAGFSKQRGVDSFCEGETEEINFCPICCRPLTDAAWEMLEKRLKGIR